MAFTAAFISELQNKQFQGNLVIEIDGTYISQYQPDSGLVVDSEYVGLLDKVSVNGVALDIRRSNTPISTIGFTLLDGENGAYSISSLLGASVSQLQNVEVKLYFGFMTGSFDFADYALLGVTRTSSVTKNINTYRFSSKESTDLMQAELLNTFNYLDGGISDVDVALDLSDATDFPASGTIKIGDEFISYTTKTLNQISGLSRASLGSTAADHATGTQVSLVTKKEDSSMNIALDILLNDLAIDAALIDSASFTTLRDGDFSGEDDFTLYVYDVENALKWLETRILDATNTRLFSVNGVITIGILDDVPKFGTTPEITEDDIIGNPSWSIGSSKIVNKIIINWNYSEGARKFLSTTVTKDEDSIAIYGERAALTYKYYGVFSSSIVSNRASRALSRFSTPKASVKTTTHLTKLGINIADNVRLIHRFLPQAGGTLGFNDVMEVMSKSVSGLQSSSKITFGLEFSSYTGIRIGLIQPSPKLDLVITDQKTFEVPDGSCYQVGYALKLWDNINNLYFTDAVNTIASISGNFITMTNDWTTILGSNVSLYFSDYEDASGDQRAQYAFIAPDTNIFVNDNSKAYQIIF